MARILLVEPDEMYIPALGEALTILGYSYSPARNAYEGLILLQKRKFDAIITDVSPPFVQGQIIIEEIAKLPDPPPVIAMAYNLASEKLNPVVKEVIEKTVNINSLKEVLQRHISATKD